MIEDALCLAIEAHKGQKRKYSGMPYIVHPIAVFHSVNGEDAKVVALLHDVVEDSPITVNDLRKRFSSRISEAVDHLTRREGENYVDFILRAKKNELARIVKIADIEHNMSTLGDGDTLRDRYEKALKELRNV